MNIKYKFTYIISMLIIAVSLFSACEDDPVGPDTVPIKAEIKQVIVKNSIYRTDLFNQVAEDRDTVIVTVPQGTDITQMDLDILVSYFSSLVPEAGVTDLTQPVFYDVTSNIETREVMVMANVVPPSLKSFRITSPVEVIGIIEDNTVTLEVMEGTDLSSTAFVAEYFGEGTVPDQSQVLDLTQDNPTIKVINQGFENVYNIVVNYYSIIEFTGSIYDGAVHPNEFLPGSVAPEDADGWVVESDPDAYKGNVVHFTSLDDDNSQADFNYGNMGLNGNPDETTTVFRAKGIDVAGEHYFEIAFKIGDLRAKFLLRKDRIEIVAADKVKLDYPLEADPTFVPTDWNIYRVTCNNATGVFKLYINENADPLVVTDMGGHDPGATVLVGDGGGKKYEFLLDYMAFEAEGAYSPEDLPLNEIIIE